MSAADDIIFAPIFPDDELKKLVKRIIENPNNRQILDDTADEIVDLFSKHGITDEQQIIDGVYKRIGEIEGSIAIFILPGRTSHTGPHTRSRAMTSESPHRPAWF